MQSTSERRLVIVGATGMVGGYALRYALDNPVIGSVTVIGRKQLGFSHPKLKEVLHQDFADCSALADTLSNQDAAIFCLGAYTGVVPDADGRANNRVQIVSAPGQSLQLGSLGDTANGLRLMNLADAPVSGYTASNTNSGVAASAGALNTSITINGVTTAINQGNGAFDSAQNAQFIADAINNNSSNLVSAAAQPDGTITLTQKTAGSQNTVAVTGTYTWIPEVYLVGPITLQSTAVMPMSY